jgi:broad specificity phosphatase PhoE
MKTGTYEGDGVLALARPAHQLSPTPAAARRLTQRLLLIRHGETEWNVSGQHTGVTDIPLTERGRLTATWLARLFSQEPFALVLSSPLQRARATCELAGLGAGAEISDDLMEWNYGDYEGLTRRQIQTLAPDWMLFRDGCPGGETAGQVAERADRVIARVRAVDGLVALFAHGHLFRVLAARWLGLPAAAGCHFILDTSTISVLGYYRGIPAVKRWNNKLMP